MRDTMTIALQLHREAKTFAQGKGNVSIQDIELHRRLLQVSRNFNISDKFETIPEIWLKR